MSSQSPITLAFTINDIFLKPLQVALISLYTNAHKDTVYHVYVLNYKLQAQTRASLEATQKSYHPQGLIHFLDMSDEHYSQIPLVGAWGPTAAGRLLLPLLLPQLSSIIYLDADVLILDDLTELAATPLTGKAFAGVFEERWIFAKQTRMQALAMLDKRNLEEFYYCNSGVLVINLEYWREHNFTAEAFRLMAMGGDIPGFCPDQDAINYLTLRTGGAVAVAKLGFEYNYNPRTLSLNYNYGSETQKFYRRTEDQLFLDSTHAGIEGDEHNPLHRAENFKPKIVHFVACEPWAIRHADVPFRTEYQEYANKIGWKMPDSIFYNNHMKELIIKVKQRPSYFILLSIIVGLSVLIGLVVGLIVGLQF